MADTAPKPQRRRQRRARKNTENVEINIDTKPDTATVQSVSQRQRRRRRRRIRRPLFGPWLPGQSPRTRLRREIKREIKKEGLEGPRVSVQQRVSSTFGLVGPNKSGNVELELNFFLHPSLAKEANDGTSFGPVQALAAQYALWKLKYLKLTFTPMVGASAVSGTVVRASLNLSQSPGGTNWSGLGTRLHLDMHPGQKAIFHLRGDQIGGPRDGGWWLTDTNEEGSQSAGPIIEVHTLGKTMSTFKSEVWDSPLFIVEGVGIWQFANYQVKPALGQLERRQAEVDATITGTPGEPITMELPVDSTLYNFMMDAEPEGYAVPATNSIGETIFQIVDVGADLAKTYAPPPFSWLISGGWWFLKRAFGRERNAATATFYVYPSLSDAQNDRPAIAGPTAEGSKGPTKAELIVTQINAPNVGPQPTASAHVRASVPVPMKEGPFRLHSEMYPMQVIAWEGPQADAYPSSFIIGKAHPNGSSGKQYVKTSWYVTRESGDTVTSQTPSAYGSYVHTLYRLENPRFTDASGNLEYIPPEPKSGASLYYGLPGSQAQTNYVKIGEVVASAHVMSGNTNYLGMVFTLIKATTQKASAFSSSDNELFRANLGGTSGTQRKMVKYQQVSVNDSVSVRTMEFDIGTYFLGVSVAADPSSTPIQYLTGTKVDLAVSLPFNKVATSSTTDSFFRMDGLAGVPTTPIMVPYDLVGGIFPALSVDITLLYVSKVEVDEDFKAKLIALGVKCDPIPEEFQLEISETDESSDEGEFLEEYVQHLLETGRLPNSAEIAAREKNYKLAFELYRQQ